MSTPSDQLHAERRAALSQALSSRRPVLHHLNADTSWLLQIARPQKPDERTDDRVYYNILLDPWLSGSQSDVASWVSTQEHATESRVPSIAAVNALLHNIESLAKRQQLATKKARRAAAATRENAIDVVVISHEFTDHCHKDTLVQIDASVPVFATKKGADLIKSWSHFDHVHEIPTFGADLDWESTSTPPLPRWLGISRLVSAKDALDLHSAIMLAFNTSGNVQLDDPVKDAIEHHEHDRLMAEEAAEAVIYTPHGISDAATEIVAKASPPIHTLTLLHGLDDISLGGGGKRGQLNLGGHNGLKVQRVLDAKYWISTHDEKKHGKGLVGWLLNRTTVSVKDALLKEQGKPPAGDRDVREPLCMDLKNGESRILL